MNHAKLYIYSLVILTLFSCSQSLWAMKEIKNHRLKIEKKTENEKDIIIPQSIRVFDISKIIPLNIISTCTIDKNTIAFLYTDDIIVFDLIKGLIKTSLRKIIGKQEIKITSFSLLSKSEILFGDSTGYITNWNFEKKSYTWINVSKFSVDKIIKLSSQKIFVLAGSDTHIIKNLKEIIPLKTPISSSELFIEKLSSTKICYGSQFGSYFSILNLEGTNYIGKTVISPDCRNPAIAKVKRISQNTCACIYSIMNTGMLDVKSSVEIIDTQSQKINQSFTLPKNTYGLLSLTMHNAFIIYTKKEIIIQSTLPPHNIIQCLGLHDFSENFIKSDTIFGKKRLAVISIHYLKKENKIIITTQDGFIITCNCIPRTKNNLSSNLAESLKRKNFKDLTFFYK